MHFEKNFGGIYYTCNLKSHPTKTKFGLRVIADDHASGVHIDIDEQIIFYFNSHGTPTIRIELLNT